MSGGGLEDILMIAETARVAAMLRVKLERSIEPTDEIEYIQELGSSDFMVAMVSGMKYRVEVGSIRKMPESEPGMGEC